MFSQLPTPLRPTPRRVGLALAAAVAGLGLSPGAAAATVPPEETTPTEETTTAEESTPPEGSAGTGDTTSGTDAGLRIMLTNDDGWSGGGLLVLRDALVDAGFEVVVVAPADDQSGNSGRITTSQPLTVTQEEAGVFSVNGSPADSAMVGLSIAYPGEQPDLVISGPNPGANLGNASIHSGTVGAAVTAASRGVSAIAVSINGDPAAEEFDYTVAQTFVIDLVETLDAQAGGGRLLPEGVALSVNLPFVPAGEELAGVSVAASGVDYFTMDYSAVEPPAVGESVDVSPEFEINPEGAEGSDVAAVTDGRAAISLLGPSYDLAADPAAEGVIADLTPVLTGLLD